MGEKEVRERERQEWREKVESDGWGREEREYEEGGRWSEIRENGGERGKGEREAGVERGGVRERDDGQLEENVE